MNVLIVDAEPVNLGLYAAAFAAAGSGAVITTAGTLKQYRERIAEKQPDMVFLSLDLPDGGALSALSSPAGSGRFPIIVIGGRGAEKAAVAAIKAGAFDFIGRSPEDLAALPLVAEQAVAQWAVIKTGGGGAEGALAAERDLLAAVFDSSPVALLVIDDKMRIVLANATVSAMAGADPCAISSHGFGAVRACAKYSSDPGGCGYSPDCPLCKLRLEVTALITSGKELPWHEMQMSFFRDGKLRHGWFHVSVSPVILAGTRYTVVAMADITARKEAERAEERSRSRYSAVFGQSPIAIEYYDEAGVLVGANESCMEMFGVMEADEIAGASLFADPNIPGEAKASLLRQEPVHIEVSFNFEDVKERKLFRTTRSGTALLDYYIAPMLENDKISGYVAQVQDITERKRAEDKIKASLAEKEVLLKEIHHRVKNNLQVVSSLLNLQARTVKDEAVRAAFTESRSRVRAMALVHEILYRSHDFAGLNMRDYAAKLIEVITGAYVAEGKVRVVCDICDCPLSVDMAVSLGLILNELVTNSFKYAFCGGRAGILTITLAREAGGYCLSVADDGPGLPADYDLRKAGTLGMQLVTTLVGQISGTVATVPARGACVQVRFPG